jgi:hypothetical protein
MKLACKQTRFQVELTILYQTSRYHNHSNMEMRVKVIEVPVLKCNERMRNLENYYLKNFFFSTPIFTLGKSSNLPTGIKSHASFQSTLDH